MGKLETLKKMLEESHYTVALCGSGMMEEGGFVGIKIQERAYEIEKRYGASPEELFSSRYYNTRPEKFFQFYKRETGRQVSLPSGIFSVFEVIL